MARRDKEKDMSKLRDLPRFGKVVEAKRADIRNYNGGMATMRWGFNEDVALDQIFELTIPVDKWDAKAGRVTALIDWQELAHYGRAVSDAKYAMEQLRLEAERRLLAGR